MDIVFDLVSMDVVSSQVDSKVSEVPRLGWCLINGTFSEMIFDDICTYICSTRMYQNHLATFSKLKNILKDL